MCKEKDTINSCDVDSSGISLVKAWQAGPYTNCPIRELASAYSEWGGGAHPHHTTSQLRCSTPHAHLPNWSQDSSQVANYRLSLHRPIYQSRQDPLHLVLSLLQASTAWVQPSFSGDVPIRVIAGEKLGGSSATEIIPSSPPPTIGITDVSLSRAHVKRQLCPTFCPFFLPKLLPGPFPCLGSVHAGKWVSCVWPSAGQETSFRSFA